LTFFLLLYQHRLLRQFLIAQALEPRFKIAAVKMKPKGVKGDLVKFVAELQKVMRLNV
jgi:DNA-binding sugar fermentation-stimulating protein